MPLDKVGAGWIKQGKSGSYINVKVDKNIHEGTWLMIFKNKRKQQPKHPDYNLYRQVTDEEAAQNHGQQSFSGGSAMREATPMNDPLEAFMSSPFAADEDEVSY